MHTLKPFTLYVCIYCPLFMAYLLTLFWYETNKTLQLCLPIIVAIT